MTNARFDPASVAADDEGVRLTVGPEGGTAEELRAAMMLVATGRAANVEDIGLETTAVQVEKGVIVVDGHMRTAEPGVYRDRRHRRRPLARAHGRARGDRRRAHDRRRPRRPPDGLRHPAARHLLPARDRLDRADRGAVPRARPFVPRPGRMPFQAVAKALIGGEYRRLRQGDRPATRPATCSGSTSSGRTPPTSSRRLRGDPARRPQPGRSGQPRTPPDALGDPRRGGHGRRRPLDQHLGSGGRTGAGTMDAGRASRRASHLGAPVRADRWPGSSRCTG